MPRAPARPRLCAAPFPVMASEQAIMRLVLPARSENVGLVRHTVAGLAEAVGMDEAGGAHSKAGVTPARVHVAGYAHCEGGGGAPQGLLGPSGRRLAIIL